MIKVVFSICLNVFPMNDDGIEWRDRNDRHERCQVTVNQSDEASLIK